MTLEEDQISLIDDRRSGARVFTVRLANPLQMLRKVIVPLPSPIGTRKAPRVLLTQSTIDYHVSLSRRVVDNISQIVIVHVVS